MAHYNRKPVIRLLKKAAGNLHEAIFDMELCNERIPIRQSAERIQKRIDDLIVKMEENDVEQE